MNNHCHQVSLDTPSPLTWLRNLCILSNQLFFFLYFFKNDYSIIFRNCLICDMPYVCSQWVETHKNHSLWGSRPGTCFILTSSYQKIYLWISFAFMFFLDIKCYQSYHWIQYVNISEIALVWMYEWILFDILSRIWVEKNSRFHSPTNWSASHHLRKYFRGNFEIYSEVDHVLSALNQMNLSRIQWCEGWSTKTATN